MEEEKELIQNRLIEICNDIKRLKAEEKALHSKLNEIVVLENTEVLLNKVADVTRDSSMVIRLCDKTRTTPIMDEFFYSDKSFLIFDKIFSVSVGKKWSKVSLVVTKSTSNIKFTDSGLTMTGLKKYANMYISDSFLNSCSESARIYPLAKEIIIASSKTCDKNYNIPFENVLRLRGQIYLNQTGYGSTYEGVHQVSQGTLYGETTSFYLIGIILS